MNPAESPSDSYIFWRIVCICVVSITIIGYVILGGVSGFRQYFGKNKS